jgi:hypothetical protein
VQIDAKQKVGAIGLIALSKTLFSASEAVTLYATLLAPVALVLLVNSFQPLFVFAFGIVRRLRESSSHRKKRADLQIIEPSAAGPPLELPVRPRT